MTLSEARAIATKVSAPDFVLSSMTTNDVIQVEQAFAVFVDLILSGSAALSGTPRVDIATAINVIKSTNITKVVLALRNNKKVPPEITLVTVLSRVALGRLQNVGDRYEIDYDKFTIGFKLVESIKPDYDSDGIIKEAGLSVHTEIVNNDLADCFKKASAPINPSGCLQAITDGKLDAKYKTDVSSIDILVDFAWKGE